MSRLLTYLCSKFFAGEADQIKEYNIAVDLLGRSVDFDPADNASARVEVHRLRKKLRTYYESEGADRDLRIEIPAGTYVPQFVPRPSAQSKAEPSPVATAVLEPDQALVAEPVRGEALTVPNRIETPKRSWVPWLAAAGVGLALVGLAVMQLTRKSNPEFETFWRPVVEARPPRCW